MEFNQYFEVSLNFISSNEYQAQSEIYRREYEPLAVHMLNGEGIFLFEEDLLSRYHDKPLQEILDENINYVPGINLPNPAKDGKRCRVYYDTWMPLYIGPRNRFYDHFFAYQLKHTDLLKVDEFLAFQLRKYHNDNFTAFARLLKLIVRKFADVVIPEKTVVTIQEWVADREQENLSGPGASKKHGRINRRADDNVTSLNREQTILLIQYMKESGVFLKDEYLTDADAGKAFELLTGYSQHTLRQDLGKYYQFQSKENLKKLHQVLTVLAGQIDKQLKAK